MSAELKFTKDHEWLRVEGGTTAVIGITEFAQDALGDLVFVELPEMGKIVKKGQAVAVVELVKTAAEVYSPVSGEVVAVNDNLSASPDLLKSPIETGWIAKVRIDNAGELEGLMDRAAYDAFLKNAGH